MHKPGAAAAFEAGAGGYGYNDQFIGGIKNPLARISEIAKASETVMFTDAAFMQATGVYIEYSFVVPPFWPVFLGPPQFNRPNPSIHFRHLDTASVAWADGHVDFQQMTWTRDYVTNSKITAKQAEEFKLGYFGPETNELFDLE